LSSNHDDLSTLHKREVCEQSQCIDRGLGLMRTVLSLVVHLQIRVLAETQVAACLKAVAPEFVLVEPVEDLIAAVEMGQHAPAFCRPTVFKPQPSAPRVA
jgi:hypothetical protein